MTDILDQLEAIEDQIEEALWQLEIHDELEKALVLYQDAETQLAALGLGSEDPAYAEGQRVLSYVLMRQGNLLRQLGKPDEALALSERELAAARASGDEIMLARSLLSGGTNQVVSGKVAEGLAMITEARERFGTGEGYDQKQGVGWCWIIEADMANAGLIERTPAQVIEIASRALEVLRPIENWPGVARAYAARAAAHEKLGHPEAAARDRQEEQQYEQKAGSNPKYERGQSDD